MSSSAERWKEQSDYDLATAQAMLASGRYLYVLFCCQQAVEKMLKALIVERNREFPPRIHQLVRLAQAAGLNLENDKADFFRELSSYYIQSRYPEEFLALASRVNKDEARRVLTQAEEVLAWLKSMQ